MSDRAQHNVVVMCTEICFDYPDQPSSGRCRIDNEKYKGEREREEGGCLYIVKGKGKGHPRTGHEGPEGN